MTGGYGAVLSGVKGIGAKTLRALLDAFGSAEGIWQAGRERWKETGLLSPRLLSALSEAVMTKDPDREERRMEELGIFCLSFREEGYPPLLKETHNPPAFLFVRGDKPVWEKTIAIVGARKGTAYGINSASHLARGLSEKGVVVVSGGARGIDSAAHRGAMEGGAPTVAVMACGLDIAYPPENRNLFDRIACGGGAVISEYPPGTPPLGRQFPARNRIIAGMSRGVIVTEAAERSGSLITADFALEEGRDVFAVPGSIWSPLSRGTHRLIRGGAICCTAPDDVLSEYRWNECDTIEHTEKAPVELSLEEELVYRFCSMGEAASEEELLAQTALSVPRLTVILLGLQLKGMITEGPKGHFTAASGR